MKKILVLILSVATLVGCTLEEKVISASEPNTYYQTVPQCKTGLNGCYIPLKLTQQRRVKEEGLRVVNFF